MVENEEEEEKQEEEEEKEKEGRRGEGIQEKAEDDGWKGEEEVEVDLPVRYR